MEGFLDSNYDITISKKEPIKVSEEMLLLNYQKGYKLGDGIYNPSLKIKGGSKQLIIDGLKYLNKDINDFGATVVYMDGFEASGMPVSSSDTYRTFAVNKQPSTSSLSFGIHIDRYSELGLYTSYIMEILNYFEKSELIIERVVQDGEKSNKKIQIPVIFKSLNFDRTNPETVIKIEFERLEDYYYEVEETSYTYNPNKIYSTNENSYSVVRLPLRSKSNTLKLEAQRALMTAGTIGEDVKPSKLQNIGRPVRIEAEWDVKDYNAIAPGTREAKPHSYLMPTPMMNTRDEIKEPRPWDLRLVPIDYDYLTEEGTKEEIEYIKKGKWFGLKLVLSNTGDINRTKLQGIRFSTVFDPELYEVLEVYPTIGNKSPAISDFKIKSEGGIVDDDLFRYSNLMIGFNQRTGEFYAELDINQFKDPKNYLSDGDAFTFYVKIKETAKTSSLDIMVDYQTSWWTENYDYVEDNVPNRDVVIEEEPNYEMSIFAYDYNPITEEGSNKAVSIVKPGDIIGVEHRITNKGLADGSEIYLKLLYDEDLIEPLYNGNDIYIDKIEYNDEDGVFDKNAEGYIGLLVSSTKRGELSIVTHNNTLSYPVVNKGKAARTYFKVKDRIQVESLGMEYLSAEITTEDGREHMDTNDLNLIVDLPEETVADSYKYLEIDFSNGDVFLYDNSVLRGKLEQAIITDFNNIASGTTKGDYAIKDDDYYKKIPLNVITELSEGSLKSQEVLRATHSQIRIINTSDLTPTGVTPNKVYEIIETKIRRRRY